MNVQVVMQKARRLIQESGLTYREVGIRMGYPPESARQSVNQFLGSTNPSVAMLLKFCKAMEVGPEELL
jgi:transcriptional regulator with XRE-family HTH domain